MEKDLGTWIPQLHSDWQLPNLSTLEKQNGFSALLNPGMGSTMVTRNETSPAYVSSAQPHLQLGHSNEPHGWFYCLPRFRQAFMPAPNHCVEEKLPACHLKGSREEAGLNGESQKRFLVVDQTGDQTTFMYSSGLGSWHHSKLHGPNNLNGNEPSFTREVNDFAGLSFDAKVEVNQGTDVESELHEDTEEINALLYSDSDEFSTEDDDDDDEVTSTGHSPSTMTTHDDSQEIVKGATEEVGSCDVKSKKRKLSGWLTGRANDDDDTASSLNLEAPFEKGDDIDAESRCSMGKSQRSEEMGCLSGSKKMRKEKIRDVLSVLQSIVPGGKGKDPILLLDEAIRCLKSLKLKARVLGLDASWKLEN